MKINKGLLQQLSTLSTIYRSDETRAHINSVVNIEVLSSVSFIATCTDGYTLVTKQFNNEPVFITELQDHYTEHQLLKLDDGTYSIAFDKTFRCKKSEAEDLTTLRKREDWYTTIGRFPAYKQLIPVKEGTGTPAYGTTTQNMVNVLKVLKLFGCKTYRTDYYGTLKASKITSKHCPHLTIILMPCRLDTK